MFPMVFSVLFAVTTARVVIDTIVTVVTAETDAGMNTSVGDPGPSEIITTEDSEDITASSDPQTTQSPTEITTSDTIVITSTPLVKDTTTRTDLTTLDLFDIIVSTIKNSPSVLATSAGSFSPGSTSPSLAISSKYNSLHLQGNIFYVCRSTC